MKLKGNGTLFPEDLLEKLPINYRYLTMIKSDTFQENYVGYRFSKSLKHSAKEFINAQGYKPISDIILQDIIVLNTL
jgi:hypothetical protein